MSIFRDFFTKENQSLLESLEVLVVLVSVAVVVKLPHWWTFCIWWAGRWDNTCNGWTYHTFKSSGSLVISGAAAAKTAEFLIVAGGGGGGVANDNGSDGGGGAGAGNVNSYSNFTSSILEMVHLISLLVAEEANPRSTFSRFYCSSTTGRW